MFFESVTAADVAACLDVGADPSAQDAQGRTPIYLAAWKSREPAAVIEALTAAGGKRQRDDRRR